MNRDEVSAVTENAKFEVAVLERIDFGEIQILKLSQQWQSSKANISNSRSRQIAYSWQSILKRHGSPVSDSDLSGRLVLLYLANQAQPIVCKVILTGQQQIKVIFIATSQQIVIPVDQYDLFFPE